jgi:exonuclease SbcD
MPPMLRLAHLADTHIGMENYGRINPETGLNQRLHDFLHSLDQALDGALAASVDLVVIAGDIYKTRDPTPTHEREFARRIRKVLDAGVPVFIAAGNHDIPLSPGRATSVDIFRALEVPRITVARTLSLHTLDTPGGTVQILAFPWSVRSQVLAASAYKNLSIADLNQAMIDLSRGKLLELSAELDPTLPTILVGHAHLFGARIGSERILTMGSDPMYDLRTFDLPGVDYVALGHIHKHQALAYGDPPIVYAGSLDRVDFSEEQEEKGWVYVEILEKGRAEWQFRKVQARPFVIVDARVESDNPTEDVVKAIARVGESLRDAVVKLRIDVPPERLAELRDEDIRIQLKTAYYVAPIERNVRRRTRHRWGDAGASIQHARPLDALATYLERQNVEPERRDLLLSYARALLDTDEHPTLGSPND